MKKKEFDNLITSMSKCGKCMSLKKRNGRDCSLVNIYLRNPFGYFLCQINDKKRLFQTHKKGK